MAQPTNIRYNPSSGKLTFPGLSDSTSLSPLSGTRSINRGPRTGSMDKGAGLPDWFPLNRKVAFYGESHVGGAGASNAGAYGFPIQSVLHAGSLHHPPSLMTLRANPGQRSDVVLSSVQANVATDNPDIAVLQNGTNDASQGFDPITYTAANIIAELAACGSRIKIVCTPPPRKSDVAADVHLKLSQQRAWIISNAATYGYLVADVYGLIADGSGYLPAAYDGGDGIHLNDLGHTKWAKAVAAAIKSVQPVRKSLVASLAPSNLILNGLFAGALGTQPAGFNWSNGSPVTSGTAPTLTVVASPNDAFSKDGQGYKIAVSAAAATSIRRAAGLTTGFAAGDKLLFVGKLRVNPNALDWDDLVINQKTAIARMIITNGGSGANIQAGYRCSALDQEIAFTYTVASGVTNILEQINLDLPTGVASDVTAYEWGVLNLTTLGYADSIKV